MIDNASGKTQLAAAEEVGATPVLLSGGNPQMAMADGDAPVQAFIAATPEWQSDVGSHPGTLIVRTVPKLREVVPRIESYEGKLAEEQMAEWVRQAAALPGLGWVQSNQRLKSELSKGPS